MMRSRLARRLSRTAARDPGYRAYGGSHATLDAADLSRGMDIAALLHPGHQHSPRLLPGMTAMAVTENYDAVFFQYSLWPGSRSARGLDNSRPYD